MAISNERARLNEFLSQGSPAALADFIANNPKLQESLLEFNQTADISVLVEHLRGKPQQVALAQDFLDDYLEINSGKLPVGKLPSAVRWRATRDSGYDSAQKAKESFESAFKAVSRGKAAKAAFSVASLMYHASSASLSFLNLTKREKVTGTIVGASMAALTALWPASETNIGGTDMDSIIDSDSQAKIEEPVVASKPLAKDAGQSVQTQGEFTLQISGDVTLTFEDEESFQRAKNYIENADYQTYMGAPVNEELRKAFVVGDALTPYPYEFWQGQAFAESTFNEKALNKSTMARGIMQMTPDTTLEILYDMKEKPEYGFIPETKLVTKSFDEDWVASYSVQDGIDKDALIASVAYDPLKAVMVAAEFNSKYFSLLQDKYPDREMDSVDAYVLHWQGYTGSQKLFEADATDPAVGVYGANSGVVQNHKTIFYEDAKNAKGKRTVEDMLAYIRADRGLGNIPIPKIAEWDSSFASLSYKPQSAVSVAEKYMATFAPLISQVPKPRPDFSAAKDPEQKVMARSLKPKPKPPLPGVEPG